LQAPHHYVACDSKQCVAHLLPPFANFLLRRSSQSTYSRCPRIIRDCDWVKCYTRPCKRSTRKGRHVVLHSKFPLLCVKLSAMDQMVHNGFVP
jgi:hypothetical protein